MNKQSITFKADEQGLIKTGGINSYASNIVAYIEATFELGENWAGYDSVRAVWSNDYLTDISTVLDPNGRCIVPTEVLTDTGNVTVNLVGSISVDDELTDRLTTYPCKALIVDEDAKVEGDETESITPSQFEQFVQIVHDEVEEVTGMSAEAETLPAGSDATASYSDGVLSLGIPKGDKGEQGEQGETGHTGEPAGFGDVTASVDNTVGTPSVAVHTSGPDTAKEFDFEFHNLKGDKGDTGETGATGNGIASTVLNPDYTLTITFTDGTSYTTPSIRGEKGDKGDTGDTGATGNGIQSTVLNADYTLTITFTDGTSYTTPSIRGEQGPAGPVSDVTVNGTSVVDQNGIAKILMPELIKTVNGNPIVIDDAFGEVKNLDVELLPIQDLHGYSKPWAAGAGKNKLNPSYSAWDTTGTYIHINGVVGDGVNANMTFVDKDTSVSLAGINMGWVYEDVTNQNAGHYRWCISNGTMASNTTNESNNIAEHKICSNIFIYPNTQEAFDKLFARYNIQVELGTTPTTYEPYTNICPITGHDSVTVTDTGINQWDEQWESGYYNDSDGLPASNGTRIRTKNRIKVYPSTTYYFVAPKSGQIFYYDKDDNFISTTPWFRNATITTPSTCEWLRFYLTSTPTYENDAGINYPSTDTAYHAYHGQSKTVTLPHTVYGAGVGVTSGEGKEKRVAFQPTITSLQSINSYGIANFLFTLSPRASNGDADKMSAISNALPVQNTGISQTQTEGFLIANADTGYIRLMSSRASTVAEANQWIQDVNFLLCYILETPTDLQTTPTDITLYNGDNVISSDGDMDLTYVQDMAIVIEKLENLL